MADENTYPDPASPALTEAPEEKIVEVRSSDGKQFKLPMSAAKQCGLLRDLLADTADFEQVDPVIPLDNIESGMLAKVIEYAVYHKDEPIMTEKDEAELLCMYKNEGEALCEWDRAEYFRPMKDPYILDLIIAANYLDLTRLYCSAAKIMADRLKHYDVPGMRKLFGVVPKEDPPVDQPPEDTSNDANVEKENQDPQGEAVEAAEAADRP